MRTHHEVEQTYAPASGATLPDLTDLPGVAGVGEPRVAVLAATYFDTAELALLRAGVTLRRRTGGADEGWHLKLPSEVGREELQLPLGTAAMSPPTELLARVRGWTRGAPVVPAATIETRRTERPLLDVDGIVLAELADDLVTGTALGEGSSVSWREWELELVDGQPTLLEDANELMGRAGVPVSDVPRKILHVLGARLGSPRSLPAVGRHKPAGNLLRRRLAEQVEELQRRDSQVRAGSAEGIHQARVACRRMRSALATYRPLVDRAVTDPLRDELQWLGRALADARDAKVVRARLGALVDSEPEGLVGRDVRPRLADTYEGRARAAGAEVAEVLDSDRYFALLDALDLLVAEPPFTSRAGKPADEVLRPRVRKDWKRLRRSLAMAQEAEDRDLAMHRARKDAKRFRYAVEALAPVWHKDARRLAKAAKKLTSHLGERQDTVVTRQHLIDIARSAEAAGEGGFTWGRLHAREEALALRLDEDLSGLWGKVSRKKLRAWMR